MTTATTAVEPLKLVPFNSGWVTSDKLDLKAIYRRPRYKRGEFDEIVRDMEDGLPAWDLTSPLPVRRHNDWVAKGFEYVTLADRSSLNQAAKSLRDAGLEAGAFDQHPELGPWNPKRYLATQRDTDRAAFDQLRADVERFGSEAVQAIRRTVQPSFELPLELRGIPPGGRPAAPAAEAAQTSAAGAAGTSTEGAKEKTKKAKDAQ